MQSRAGANDRAELLGQRGDAGAPGSASHRERLLHSTQKLDKSGERIQQSRQMVAEMEVRLFWGISPSCPCMVATQNGHICLALTEVRGCNHGGQACFHSNT